MGLRRYQVKVGWRDHNGTTSYRAYHRRFEVAAAGKEPFLGAADPTFLGDAHGYHPEELLLAALSSCHLLWYLHLCADAGVVVLSYHDDAEASLEEGPSGGAMTGAVLRPRVEVATQAMVGEARRLHGEAARRCFVARSVAFPVVHEPTVLVAGSSAAPAGRSRLGVLERLAAHEEIRQLVARYALAVDQRDVDALVELFVADVDAGRLGRGRPALRRFFDDSLSNIGLSILAVTTHVIDVHDATKASGVVYCRGEIEVAGRLVHQAIVYDDEYRHDGRWLFVRRRHRLFYGSAVGIDPLGLPPANWPARHEGRGTLPEEWESWQRFWATRPGA